MTANVNNTQEVVVIVTAVQQPLILVSQDVSVITVEGVHAGSMASSGVTCITTPKMPIVNYDCLLPSRPIGNFVLGIAQVYVPYGDGHFVMETHDNITLVIVNGDYFLRFLDTTYDYTGCYAVVTYIEAT